MTRRIVVAEFLDRCTHGEIDEPSSCRPPRAAAALVVQLPANYSVSGTIPAPRVLFFPFVGDTSPQPCPGGGTGMQSYPGADSSPDVGDVVTTTMNACTTGTAGVDLSTVTGTTTRSLIASVGDLSSSVGSGTWSSDIVFGTDAQFVFDQSISGRAYKGDVTTKGSCQMTATNDGKGTVAFADDARTMDLHCISRSTGTENGAPVSLDITGAAACTQVLGASAMQCATADIRITGDAGTLGRITLDATLVGTYVENTQGVPQARYKVSSGADVIDVQITNTTADGTVTVTAPSGAAATMTWQQFVQMATLF